MDCDAPSRSSPPCTPSSPVCAEVTGPPSGSSCPAAGPGRVRRGADRQADAAGAPTAPTRPGREPDRYRDRPAIRARGPELAVVVGWLRPRGTAAGGRTDALLVPGARGRVRDDRQVGQR